MNYKFYYSSLVMSNDINYGESSKDRRSCRPGSHRNYENVLGYIQSKWEIFAPTRPFEYFFFDEKLDAMYKDEQKLSKISIMITVLAIVIAALGLIGLTSFMVEQKNQRNMCAACVWCDL